jgi:hypothetical protein
VGTQFGPDQQAVEIGARAGDIIGRLDTLLLGSLARDLAPEGGALVSAWRGSPVEAHLHLFASDQDDGVEARATWSRVLPRTRLTLDAGALGGTQSRLFASGSVSMVQVLGTARLQEALRVDVDDEHQRAIAVIGWRSPALRLGARYQIDNGATMRVGGLTSSILPRSVYALRVLDPALPPSALAGDDYRGWRVEAEMPMMPFTAFYQRHAVDDDRLSIAGLEITTSSDPMPVLKLPGLAFTAGVARMLDGGDTNWWISTRWRP